MYHEMFETIFSHFADLYFETKEELVNKLLINNSDMVSADDNETNIDLY